MISKKILVDGTPLNVVLSDFFNPEENTIVFLHGWGQNSKSFEIIMKKFEEDKKSFVSIDFPGFGATPLPKGIWGVREYALFVKSTLDKLGIKKASFISHSFGGRVLIYLNNLYAERIDKNIFIGGAGIRKEFSKFKLAIIKLGKWVFNIPGLKKIGDKIRNKVSSRDYLASGELKDIFLKVLNEDLSEKIKNIKAETLLIRGDKDDETPLEDGKYFHENIEGSELLVLDGGHFIFLEKPKKVQNKIEEFLEK